MNRSLLGTLAGYMVVTILLMRAAEQRAYGDESSSSCPKGETQTDEGCIKNPKIRHKTKPVFPKEARRSHLEGHVTMQARVMEDGSVADIGVKESTNPGHGFEQAAIEALKKWRYAPGTLNGKPTPIYFEVTIDFTYH